MKRFSLFIVAAVALLMCSCKGTAPNDRAIYNLQGPVESLKIYDSFDELVEEIYFTEDGMIKPLESTYPAKSHETIRQYGQIERRFEENGIIAYQDIYTYDKKGRLETIKSIDAYSAYEGLLTFEYKRKETLPNKLVYVGTDENDDSWNMEYELTYEGVDEWGNYQVRKSGESSDFSESREITYYEGLGNVVNCSMKRSIDWEQIGAILLSMAIFAAVVAACVHMVIANFFRKKHKEDYTVDYFVAQRQQKGDSPEASVEVNEMAARKLDELNSFWHSVDLDDGTSYMAPFKKKEIDRALPIIEEAVAMNPTDENLVEHINGINRLLNYLEERSFNGSKTFIIVSAIIGVAMWLISGTFAPVVSILVGIGVYLLASRTPNFMMLKKEVEGSAGGRSFMTALFGGLFTAVATAKTYKTITKWSDGSTTTDTDNSETWISMIIAIVVMVVMAFLMIAVAAINYLRNYIIYR